MVMKHIDNSRGAHRRTNQITWTTSINKWHVLSEQSSNCGSILPWPLQYDGLDQVVSTLDAVQQHWSLVHLSKLKYHFSQWWNYRCMRLHSMSVQFNFIDVTININWMLLWEIRTFFASLSATDVRRLSGLSSLLLVSTDVRRLVSSLSVATEDRRLASLSFSS